MTCHCADCVRMRAGVNAAYYERLDPADRAAAIDGWVRRANRALLAAYRSYGGRAAGDEEEMALRHALDCVPCAHVLLGAVRRTWRSSCSDGSSSRC